MEYFFKQDNEVYSPKNYQQNILYERGDEKITKNKLKNL